MISACDVIQSMLNTNVDGSELADFDGLVSRQPGHVSVVFEL